VKCLRCGYCCVKYPVAILDSSSEDGVSMKEGGEACKHLSVVTENGVEMAHCGIHDVLEYEQTPCAEFDQTGTPGAPCRIGYAITEGRFGYIFDLLAYVEGGKKDESC